VAPVKVPLPPGLRSPGQIVFTRDGQRVGRIELIGRDAFKVAARGDSFWLRHGSVQRSTPGGLVILLATMQELDEWRWEPPRIRLSPDLGDD